MKILDVKQKVGETHEKLIMHFKENDEKILKTSVSDLMFLDL